MADTPAVPLTLEGSSVLHQMFRVRWAAWRALPAPERERIVLQASAALGAMEAGGKDGSAAYSILGHKGDLMLIHFRSSFDALDGVQRELRKLTLFDYLEPANSYLSMVELGLYESTQKVYNSLVEKGIEPYTPEWKAGIDETLERQRTAMAPRLYPEVPPAPYVCFYPMDRKRGEIKNWYSESMADRSRLTHEHGMTGRRYAGEVRQIITTSVGFDDWEWGVDLFAEEPLIFKKLIYEMRFDPVSAVYALFGAFVIGRRCPASQLAEYFKVE